MMAKQTAPERRGSDRPWYVRVWRWLMAPLVDRWEGLSLTRFLAIGIFVLVWHAVEDRHNMSATTVSLLFLAVATAFGKATFTMLAQRTSITATSTVTDTTNRVITETVAKRRAASDIDGAEPAP